MKNFIKKLKAFKFFQNRIIFYCIPMVLVLVGLICGTIFQLSPKYDKFANVGVDFQGGTSLNVSMTSDNPSVNVDMNAANYEYNVAIIERVLESKGFTVATNQASGLSGIIVRYSNVAYGNVAGVDAVDYGDDSKVAELKALNDEIMEQIKDAFLSDEKYAGIKEHLVIETTATMIGNSSSIKLLRSALIAVSIALAVMFLYIIIRFDPFSALAAIIALLHDVIMMMTFTVIFRIEIGSTIVAAIITIVAYSINNTIVVFDRVRDSVKPLKTANKRYDIAPIVNEAISSTFTRTFYTTLTTLITISMLAILGVSSIRSFALPIIFGLVSGFYSSVVIAAPLWGDLTTAWEKHKRKKANPDAFKKRKPKKA